jgi:phage terminase small subunit
MASREVAVSPELALAFAQQYLLDLNATQAYLRCRPDAKPNSARTNGARLLANANVQEHIATLQAERQKRYEVTADAVIQELAACAFSDHRNYRMGEDGDLEEAPGAHPMASRAVAKVKRRRTVRTFGETEVVENSLEYALWNKPQTLIALGEHLGIIRRGDGPDQLPPGGREVRVRWVNEGPPE